MDESTQKKANKIFPEMPEPRRGPGRPKGAINLSTREMREVAQRFGPEAIATLVMKMRKSKNETIQVAAAKELLVRGYGNAFTVSGPNDGPIPITYEGLTSTIHNLVGEIIGPEILEEALKVTDQVQ